MTNRRKQLRSLVVDELGNRRLVWSGLRGDDLEPLSDLPQLWGSYTISGSYCRRPLAVSLAYEDLSGTRPDLENWDIEDHLGAHASARFRRALLEGLGAPSAMLPYRPSTFLSAIGFARRDRCEVLGLSGAHQSAFEHKPWVESSLDRLGIPNLGWKYIADAEMLDVKAMLKLGSIMLRRSRTSGGEGLWRVNSFADVQKAWPRQAEGFASVAAYVPNGLPLNVGGTVWRDGTITVHHASVQLIGIPSCVTRPFGYCGNDFALARTLPRSVLDRTEATTSRVGAWLHMNGYVGTFGVDYLLVDGIPIFTELNPRFQGSSALSGRLSIETNLPCLFLEHIAAWLGLPPLKRPPLVEQMQEARDVSQVAVHWTGSPGASVSATQLESMLRSEGTEVAMEAAASPRVLMETGALVGRYVSKGSATSTGYELNDPWRTAVEQWTEQQQTHDGGPRP